MPRRSRYTFTRKRSRSPMENEMSSSRSSLKRSSSRSLVMVCTAAKVWSLFHTLRSLAGWSLPSTRSMGGSLITRCRSEAFNSTSWRMAATNSSSASGCSARRVSSTSRAFSSRCGGMASLSEPVVSGTTKSVTGSGEGMLFNGIFGVVPVSRVNSGSSSGMRAVNGSSCCSSNVFSGMV